MVRGKRRKENGQSIRWLIVKIVFYVSRKAKDTVADSKHSFLCLQDCSELSKLDRCLDNSMFVNR